MGKIISLSSRLQKSKSTQTQGPTLPPALKPVSERVDLLEKNTWTIVKYVEELEERVASQEKYLLKLLRLLQKTDLARELLAESED